jgi:putative NADH-flavin reductase
MKVLVIGATGATGTQAVPRLVKAGHEVTAFARNPDAMTVKVPAIRVMQGDVRDATALDAAVAGQDAVISVFGPARSLRKQDLQEIFMRHLVGAMEKHSVKRLMNLSAWGSSRTRQYMPWAFKPFRYLLREVFADKERGEAILFASPTIEWVNVSPGRLTDGPETGRVVASETGRGVPASISRADLAAWMIAQLSDPTWVRKSPIVGA